VLVIQPRKSPPHFEMPIAEELNILVRLPGFQPIQNQRPAAPKAGKMQRHFCAKINLGSDKCPPSRIIAAAIAPQPYGMTFDCRQIPSNLEVM
jgi:hypothetical protein